MKRWLFRILILILISGLGYLWWTRPIVIADLKVTVAENRPWIFPEGKAGELNWILDTGAGISLIDAEAAEKLPLRSTDEVVTALGLSGLASDIPLEVLPELNLAVRGGKEPFQLKDLHVVRIPGLRERVKADAMLGYRELSRSILQLDLGRERIRILGRPPRGFRTKKLALQVEAFAPIVEVSASNGHQFAVTIDTGHSGWFALGADEYAVFPDLEMGETEQGGFGIFDRIEKIRCKFPGSFDFGKVTVEHPPLWGLSGQQGNLVGVGPLMYTILTLDPKGGLATFEMPGWYGNYYFLTTRWNERK